MINRNYPVILATYLIDSENDRVITIVFMLNELLILCQGKKTDEYTKNIFPNFSFKSELFYKNDNIFTLRKMICLSFSLFVLTTVNIHCVYENNVGGVME